MKKGVSPVVATVLLIAIAVISAVAVWYWVAPMTGQQATPETAQKSYTLVDIYPNSSINGCNAIDVKNTGGITLSNVYFEIRDYQTGRQAGVNGTNPPLVYVYLNMTGNLLPGDINYYNLSTAGNITNKSSIPLGTYILKPINIGTSITGLTSLTFTCTPTA